MLPMSGYGFTICEKNQFREQFQLDTTFSRHATATENLAFAISKILPSSIF